ncbi:hypothetical protein [Cohaesibacter celericrescens]|uniref:hypothetical protein n=1 Tax=Cohaesibacter celericrescens TaxID=2067669 RepID=UPI00356147DB
MASKPVGDLTIDSISNRFCYWQGDAGIRYLFSQIALDDISSFEDCVLLLATETGTQLNVQWIGEISDLSPLAFEDIASEDLKHLTIYVHLLAGNKDARQKVIADLGDDAGRAACLLSA